MGYYSALTITMTKQLQMKFLNTILEDTKDPTIDGSLLTFILYDCGTAHELDGKVCFHLEEIKWYSTSNPEYTHFQFTEDFLRDSDPSEYKYRRKGEDHDDYEVFGDLDDHEFSNCINQVESFPWGGNHGIQI